MDDKPEVVVYGVAYTVVEDGGHGELVRLQSEEGAVIEVYDSFADKVRIEIQRWQVAGVLANLAFGRAKRRSA